jgi:hypothetical protein
MLSTGSVGISDSDVIERFVADPENTFLVSFPRTGSHWARMLMELYFRRPSLVRVFYYPKQTNYLTLHTHDLELDVERQNVIYLYRDPVETVFSQLRYHEEAPGDTDRVRYWSDLYGRHLDKWLINERFTRKKTVITYEGLRESLDLEFMKICHHFGQDMDVEHLEHVAAKVGKSAVKEKTNHDPHVVDLCETYATERKHFIASQGDEVWKALLAGRDRLKGCFPNSTDGR